MAGMQDSFGSIPATNNSVTESWHHLLASRPVSLSIMRATTATGGGKSRLGIPRSASFINAAHMGAAALPPVW